MTIIERSFLISFMVDARGGAMRGCRHSGVRIIIPPKKASMPTRITCRLIKKEKLLHPPPMNEGEALACRILEMGPTGTKFLGPIVIEVPHFASLREREREMQILRSDNGETWYEHPLIATEDAVQEAMSGTMEDLEGDDDLVAKRIARILTTDLPMYFAIVTRVRMENQQIGDEGGVLSSTVVPQVQAVFPSGALNKKIRVGLQAQPVQAELVTKMFGNRVAVSPIVTIEPRRRKFHKAITLTIPVPKAAQKGMINQYQTENPSLRLLCSIAGGPNSSVWEDITENKNLQFVNDCVSFSTTVSARFWLMDCQNIQDTARMASELYKEAITVPYMAKFVVFAKRTSVEEGKLRMFCMSDDKIDKTLEKQEHFSEVARSRDVEVLEGRDKFIEMAGNLIPVTKSGDQLSIPFKAFRENRLPCTVRIRDQDQESAARVAFMKEPKVARGEVPQTPICNLNITLPGWSKSSSMELDADSALELKKRHSLLREHGIVLEDTVSSAQIKLTHVADTLQGDWVILAQQLDITSSEINDIKSSYSTVNDQALAILQLWVEKNRERATGNALERALRQIKREDVVKKCMYNIERVEDEVERAAAKVAMDQSGFDTFTEEVGISRDSSLKKGMSLDVQFDEQDMVKESESAGEEESSEGEHHPNRPAPHALAEEELEEPITPVEEQLVAMQIVHGEGVIPRLDALDVEAELRKAPEPPQEEPFESVDDLAARLEAEQIEWQQQEQPEAAEDLEETAEAAKKAEPESSPEEEKHKSVASIIQMFNKAPTAETVFKKVEQFEHDIDRTTVLKPNEIILIEKPKQEESKKSVDLLEDSHRDKRKELNIERALEDGQTDISPRTHVRQIVEQIESKVDRITIVMQEEVVNHEQKQVFTKDNVITSDIEVKEVSKEEERKVEDFEVREQQEETLAEFEMRLTTDVVESDEEEWEIVDDLEIEDLIEEPYKLPSPTPVETQMPSEEIDTKLSKASGHKIVQSTEEENVLEEEHVQTMEEEAVFQAHIEETVSRSMKDGIHQLEAATERMEEGNALEYTSDLKTYKEYTKLEEMAEIPIETVLDTKQLQKYQTTPEKTIDEPEEFVQHVDSLASELHEDRPTAVETKLPENILESEVFQITEATTVSFERDEKEEELIVDRVTATDTLDKDTVMETTVPARPIEPESVHILLEETVESFAVSVDKVSVIDAEVNVTETTIKKMALESETSQVVKESDVTSETLQREKEERVEIPENQFPSLETRLSVTSIELDTVKQIEDTDVSHLKESVDKEEELITTKERWSAKLEPEDETQVTSSGDDTGEQIDITDKQAFSAKRDVTESAITEESYKETVPTTVTFSEISGDTFQASVPCFEASVESDIQTAKMEEEVIETEEISYLSKDDVMFDTTIAEIKEKEESESEQVEMVQETKIMEQTEEVSEINIVEQEDISVIKEESQIKRSIEPHKSLLEDEINEDKQAFDKERDIFEEHEKESDVHLREPLSYAKDTLEETEISQKIMDILDADRKDTDRQYEEDLLQEEEAFKERETIIQKEDTTEISEKEPEKPLEGLPQEEETFESEKVGEKIEIFGVFIKDTELDFKETTPLKEETFEQKGFVKQKEVETEKELEKHFEDISPQTEETFLMKVNVEHRYERDSEEPCEGYYQTEKTLVEGKREECTTEILERYDKDLEKLHGESISQELESFEQNEIFGKESEEADIIKKESEKSQTITETSFEAKCDELEKKNITETSRTTHEEIQVTASQIVTVPQSESPVSDEDLVEKPSHISTSIFPVEDYSPERDNEPEPQDEVFGIELEEDAGTTEKVSHEFLEMETTTEVSSYRSEIMEVHTTTTESKEVEIFKQKTDIFFENLTGEEERFASQEEETIHEIRQFQISTGEDGVIGTVKKTVSGMESTEISDEDLKERDGEQEDMEGYIKKQMSEDEVVDIKDESYLHGHVLSGIMIAANEEMEGEPVDFSVHLREDDFVVQTEVDKAIVKTQIGSEEQITYSDDLISEQEYRNKIKKDSQKETDAVFSLEEIQEQTIGDGIESTAEVIEIIEGDEEALDESDLDKLQVEYDQEYSFTFAADQAVTVIEQESVAKQSLVSAQYMSESRSYTVDETQATETETTKHIQITDLDADDDLIEEASRVSDELHLDKAVYIDRKEEIILEETETEEKQAVIDILELSVDRVESMVETSVSQFLREQILTKDFSETKTPLDDKFYEEVDGRYVERTESFLIKTTEGIKKDYSDSRDQFVKMDDTIPDISSKLSDYSVQGTGLSPGCFVAGSGTDGVRDADDILIDKLAKDSLPSERDFTDELRTDLDVDDKDSRVESEQSSERPLSPTDYTLETDTDMEESQLMEKAVLELEVDKDFEGRITDTSQQIFIEQQIESQTVETITETRSTFELKHTKCYEEEQEGPEDQEECPPSPSEYTLVASQDQETLQKALGITTKEEHVTKTPKALDYNLLDDHFMTTSQDQQMLDRLLGQDAETVISPLDDPEKDISQDVQRDMIDSTEGELKASLTLEQHDIISSSMDQEILQKSLEESKEIDLMTMSLDQESKEIDLMTMSLDQESKEIDLMTMSLDQEELKKSLCIDRESDLMAQSMDEEMLHRSLEAENGINIMTASMEEEAFQKYLYIEKDIDVMMTSMDQETLQKSLELDKITDFMTCSMDQEELHKSLELEKSRVLMTTSMDQEALEKCFEMDKFTDIMTIPKDLDTHQTFLKKDRGVDLMTVSMDQDELVKSMEKDESTEDITTSVNKDALPQSPEQVNVIDLMSTSMDQELLQKSLKQKKETDLMTTSMDQDVFQKSLEAEKDKDRDELSTSMDHEALKKSLELEKGINCMTCSMDRDTLQEFSDLDKQADLMTTSMNQEALQKSMEVEKDTDLMYKSVDSEADLMTTSMEQESLQKSLEVEKVTDLMTASFDQDSLQKSLKPDKGKDFMTTSLNQETFNTFTVTEFSSEVTQVTAIKVEHRVSFEETVDTQVGITRLESTNVLESRDGKEGEFGRKKVQEVTLEHAYSETTHVTGGDEPSALKDSYVSTSSSEKAQIVSYDQSDGNSMSTFGSEFGESPSAPEVPLPQPMQLEKLTAAEMKPMVSSYENVYTGVSLDPHINRMSMDASELDIGDHFDTKQPDTHLLPIGKSCSYEQLYQEKEVEFDDEGECKSESANLSPASGSVADVSTTSVCYASVVSNGHRASITSHTCPIYITVESGLDKLACADDFSAVPGGQGAMRIKPEMAERSLSCESTEDKDVLVQERMTRYSSSPQMYSPTEPTPKRKGDKAGKNGGVTGEEEEEDKLSSSSSEVAQLEDVEHVPAQKPGPVFIDPEIGDSDEDEVLVYDPQTGEPVEGAEGGESHTTRVLMKKQVHKRTVFQDGEEKTFITEESQVEQDPDTPDDIRDSMQQIIDEFMENKADPKVPSGESLEDEV